MKRIAQIIGTLFVIVFSAGIADYISTGIMNRTTISPTYFFMTVLPLITIIWMRKKLILKRLIYVAIVFAFNIVIIAVLTIIAYSIASQNIKLAAMLFGLQTIVVFVIYVILWSKLRKLYYINNKTE